MSVITTDTENIPDHRHSLRGQTAAELASLNYIPAFKEQIVESDTGRIKIGDNVTAFNDLPYLDEFVIGLIPDLPDAKASATANYTATFPFNGLPASGDADGITLDEGDRFLLPLQTAASRGGPWLVSAGPWTRPADFATGAAIPVGKTIQVLEGATLLRTSWQVEGAGVIGTNTQTWTKLHDSLVTVTESQSYTDDQIAAAESELVGPVTSVTGSLPAGLLWDATHYGFTFALSHLPDGRSVATVSKRARDFFDAVSVARTAPSQTLYVNGSNAAVTLEGIVFAAAGNDSAAGTSAAPLQSMMAAVAMAATGTTRIYVAAVDASGVTIPYGRLLRPSQTSTAPAADVALLAVGGEVNTGSWDAPTYAPDSTYPGAYRWTSSDCVALNRLDQRTPDGCYVEIPQQLGRALTKGATTSGSSRVTNAGGGDPNGVGFVSDDVGRRLTAAGIPAGSLIGGVQTINAVFLVSAASQTTRTVTLTVGNTTVAGTFTSGDVGSVIFGPGIPAQGASASVPNTIVSQTGTAAVIAKAPTASGTVTATTATAANATVTDSSNSVALTLSGSPTIVNRTPGLWCHNGTYGYYNPADGVVPGTTTVRMYRSVSDVLRVTAGVNLFAGGYSDLGRWAFEGGINGVLSANLGSDPGAPFVAAFERCSFRYARVPAGAAGTGRGVSLNSWRGLAVFEDCDASANDTDGFNGHNTVSTARSCFVLTINCTGFNNGRAPQTSCNGWTFHEDMIAADLAGRYERGHGGTVRCIGTSKIFLAATDVVDDLGDRVFGGTQAPTGIQADDSCEMWVFRANVKLQAGKFAYVATSTAQIHRREPWAVGQRLYAQSGATIDTY